MSEIFSRRTQKLFLENSHLFKNFIYIIFYDEFSEFDWKENE